MNVHNQCCFIKKKNKWQEHFHIKQEKKHKKLLCAILIN
jgi:hypothetical protein